MFDQNSSKEEQQQYKKKEGMECHKKLYSFN